MLVVLPMVMPAVLVLLPSVKPLMVLANVSVDGGHTKVLAKLLLYGATVKVPVVAMLPVIDNTSPITDTLDDELVMLEPAFSPT